MSESRALMTKQQIGIAIYTILAEKMACKNLSRFNTDARLTEDLALDSTLVLQLLIFLELECGLAVPEEALVNEDFETVRSLVQLMYQSQDIPKTEKGLEVYDDIKVHCVASCLSEVIKRRSHLDHRMLYFPVWDTAVCLDEQYTLTYHDANISHQFFFDACESLYGMKVAQWYDDSATKEDNAAKLEALVSNKTDDQHIMVMVDMFHLPERENAWNKDPFPHYLMLAPTANADEWLVLDPDYRWEGVIAKDRVLNAFKQPTVSGGYIYNESELADTPSSPAAIKAYFEQSVIFDTNPITDIIRELVTAHLNGKDKNQQPLAIEHLKLALEEVPVLSIRKYAYEHGLAFFWREVLLPEEEFETLCVQIDELSKSYKLVQYHGTKMALTGSDALADKLFKVLDEQDTREFAIKQQLKAAYNTWLEHTAQAVATA